MNNENNELDELCIHCEGTGQIEILDHVSGDNIMPGGFYEGSGLYRKCVCQIVDEFEHTDYPYSFKELHHA